MPRGRYQLTNGDVAVVHRWVRARFRDQEWPKDWPSLTAWDKFPLDKPTAKKLQSWCDRFLDAVQWKQLHAVIRAARRDASQTRTVRLATRASTLLHDLAAREQLTLSETIERYLSDALKTPAVQAIPLPTPPPRLRTKRTKSKAAGEVTPFSRRCRGKLSLHNRRR